MEVKYDSVTDSLYISLSEGKYEKTKKITDVILVDMTNRGKVLGIEILDASENIQKFNPKDLNLNIHLGNTSSHQV
ncbi:MAG: hypothetical protein UT63_C0006G0017 [Candidatus Gottesmanbacteria bacterium GW2011_GWC2_39_8]|uniref:DUF2283 domain-containing protein n=1 Tax=Candidatus Gottesmanbacteria bacterium GW2011_GWC2_39_8 TaxID=1618450 RepID=A0A0G0Q172_9BACT|nr:MAG: hypothetical protein UT63_C0006G0017 [Candidatus Gottesmanbacteria bacterium GW2011_GWC2_39_8]